MGIAEDNRPKPVVDLRAPAALSKGVAGILRVEQRRHLKQEARRPLLVQAIPKQISFAHPLLINGNYCYQERLYLTAKVHVARSHYLSTRARC
jgi:hypothetical protein